MKCTKCGTANPSEYMFCAKCGNNLQEKITNNTENHTDKKRSPKKIVICGVIALCTLIFVVIGTFFVLSDSSKYVMPSTIINCYYFSDEEETVVTVDKTILKEKIEGNAQICAISNDGKNAIALKFPYRNDDIESNDYIGKIYLISDNGIKKINDEVLFNYCGISRSGEYAYFVNTDHELKLCETKSGKVLKIADEVYGNAVMSPDGKIVLYAIKKNNDGDKELLVYNNGNLESIGNNFDPISVSNDGKHIYIINSEDSIYFTKYGSRNREKIGTDVDSYYVNCDGTELIYTSNSNIYISVKEKQKSKIGKADSIVSLELDKTGIYLPKNDHYSAVRTFINLPIVYSKIGNESFPIFYIGVISRIDKEYELKRLASDVDFHNVHSRNGNLIYYLKNGNLFETSLASNKEPLKIAEDIYEFEVSASGKYLFAENFDQTLYKIKGTDKAKIADDVYSFAMVNDKVIYITDYSDKSREGTLFSSSNGKDNVRISNEATSVMAKISICFYIDSDGLIYISDDGKTFDVLN